jgi:hypothetical protein
MKTMAVTRLSVLSLVALMPLLITGCEGEQGPQGLTGSQGSEGPPGLDIITVSGYLEGPNVWDSLSDAEVWIGNSPSIPSVSISGHKLDYDWFNGEDMEFENFDLPISPGDSAALRIEYTKLDSSTGTARASGTLPGSFGIESHDTTSIFLIPVGSSLTVSWTVSPGADGYATWFDLSYSYYDSLGVEHVFDFNLDTLLTGNYLTISSDQMFPDTVNIDSLNYSWGHFDVEAVNGPMQSGDMGNVSGDGMGLFYCFTDGGNLDLGVGGTVYRPMSGKDHLERIREFVSIRAGRRFLFD